MPLYEFTCDACGEDFDEVLKIADRDAPLSQPCYECGEEGQIRRKVAATMTVYQTGDNMMARTPDGFKDVLRDIKSKAGRGNTIDV